MPSRFSKEGDRIMLAKLKGKRGFTLVELMIVVAIIGVLAALAIYGVRKYVTNAKTAEARMALGRMSKDAAAAYNREGMSASVMSLGASTGVSHVLCGSTGASVPTGIGSVKAMKYQSSPADWQGGSSSTGWRCLGFSMESPQYFMYSYTKGGSDGSATFSANANGDLNGDGTMSTFSIGGAEKTGTTGGVVVVVAPNIEEFNPDE
jgi:type IV pilus assembly protein PilA